MAADSPKNYQLWNYRKRLALQKGPACAQEVSPFAVQALARAECRF